MHILLLAPDLKGHSGWSRYALDLGKALAKRGHRITAVVSQTSGADWCTEVPLLWNDMRYLHMPLLRSWSSLKVSFFIRETKPDIVHAMSEPLAMLLPGINTHLKRCMTIHGTYSVVPFEMSKQTKKDFADTYAVVDRIFSVSDFTKVHLQALQPALYEKEHLEEKIHVLKNGLDLTNISHEKRAKSSATLSIIGVGAVKERKGYIHAINACAAFRDTHPHVKFTYDIYGALTHQPSYVSQLQSRIKELHLEEHVKLHGRVSDEELKKAYAAADLFLLLSVADDHYFEGFGLVFLEASARGIPVIGPRSGGCPEAIEDGKSGYVCEPTDAKRVAQHMDDILLKHLIQPADCRAWAEQNDINKAAEKLEKEYQNLL